MDNIGPFWIHMFPVLEFNIPVDMIFCLSLMKHRYMGTWSSWVSNVRKWKKKIKVRNFTRKRIPCISRWRTQIYFHISLSSYIFISNDQLLMTTEPKGKKHSFRFNMLSIMEHFTRFIATYLLFLALLFLYSIQCEKITYKWRSLSRDLPYEYIFSKDYNEKRDWYDARRWWKENGGGDLLTIKSQLEARKITTELKKFKSDLHAQWTGLQDLNNDGIWTWLDGTEFDLNITKETGIVFHAIPVGSPRLCASFQTWSWILLPGSLNAQSMLLANYCPYALSFICKRNNTTAEP